MEQTILFINDATTARRDESIRLKPFSPYHSDTQRRVPFTLIAAIGRNRELGKRGDLVWHIKDDMRHFKELTAGATVIMGRKTWDSLHVKPLPGRVNIVVTRNDALEFPGADRAASLEEALEKAKGNETFIIGGESLYAAAMPLASKLEITHIDADDVEADTWFPEIKPEEWQLTAESETRETAKGTRYKFSTYRRKE